MQLLFFGYSQYMTFTERIINTLATAALILGKNYPIQHFYYRRNASHPEICCYYAQSLFLPMLQLEENFDWPNSHYLNFVSTNDFMWQEF
jgi:hypothetical protein